MYSKLSCRLNQDGDGEGDIKKLTSSFFNRFRTTDNDSTVSQNFSL